MTTGRRADALGPCLAWISHPLSVAGLALLLINDHLLKDAWPGVITGKLSDIAGMLMFPPVLAVMLAILLPAVSGRFLAGFAVIATGVCFAVLKVSPVVAELASRAWSVPNGPSAVLADSTDLVALPVLALTWAVWRRCRKKAATDRFARQVRALVLVPAGLLATVATSAASYDTVTWVGEIDGQMAYGYGIVNRDSTDAIHSIGVSADGGHTFTPLPTKEQPVRHTKACTGSICYQVVPGELHVQESRDGGVTWSTAWQIAGWQYRALAADHLDLNDPKNALASQCIAIFEGSDGYVVMVANARDGLLRRDASGHWERLGVPGSTMVPLRAEPDFTGHRVLAATLGVVAVGLAGLGLLVASRRHVVPPRRARAFAFLVPAAFVFDVCIFLPDRLTPVLWLLWGLVNAAALLACGAVALVLPLRQTAALVPVAAATAWIAQIVYRVEPASDADLFFFRAGSGLAETAQSAVSLVPVAIGMAAAAVAAFMASRIRSTADHQPAP
ncbi:hypothetical protein Rhe02_18990 [Rhizocola hellebori]|uniref:Uncharacterized protein n=1 Tax=Rhizocola hellebori TaxID=1392758 RepID=A0A8J3Q5U4_9ACTN|nr:hypothetical protein [Rhizocola hellebori]GIH03832.1 hypothetical protein Rhe02_18990 [Rhizocola hellebori]